jgi:transmembrane sensor
MMDKLRAQELASKWLKGTITEEEKTAFTDWYNSHNDVQFHSTAEDEALLKERIFNRIIENTHALDKHNRAIQRNWKWQLGVAASLLIVFSTIFFYSINSPEKAIQSEIKVPTLTFADGRTIELNANQQGIIAGQEIKYINGQSLGTFSGRPGERLKLSTPKGLIYVITLPDGSKVTLNAGSTLTYPSVFSQEERLVELEGEAFFEVTKVNRRVAATSTSGIGKNHTTARVPFKVKSAGQNVEVMGTKFNLSAYSDEPLTKTTLVEGRVSVMADKSVNSSRKNPVFLLPGQQAIFAVDGISVRSVDTEPFIAWKDGYFYFENASVPTVMAQLQRWYDFEITYESAVPDQLFFGKIPKSIPLQDAIKILNKAGIKIQLNAENNVFISSTNKPSQTP